MPLTSAILAASLVICGDRDYPPIEYLEDGHPKGLSIEILDAISKETGMTFDIRLTEWKSAQEDLLAGRCDAISVMSISDERNRDFDFSKETLRLTFSIFTRQDDLRIQSGDDLAGMSIGVKRGGFPETLLKNRPDAHLVLVETYAKGFEQLVAGKIDAVAADTWVGGYSIQKDGFSGIRMVREPFASRRAGFAVRKGNTAVVDELDQGMAQLRKSGKLDQILGDWSSQEIVYLTKDRVYWYVAFAAVVASILAVVATALWIVSLRRTRELKESQERLRQAEKMQALGQLAGGIAHDFNNQLGGILGFATLLAKMQTNPKAREYCDLITRAARHSADLTRQLLTFARKGHQKREVVDVHALIGDVAAILGRSLDKRIRLETKLAAPTAMVTGDAALLQTSLLNLAINGRDAMPDGGVLQIETWAEADTLHIAVRDSGVGMSDEVKRRIFEPFFTTKGNGGGTGMGLALVHGTAESHGGTITVRSVEGEGSTFELCLPLLANAPPPAPRQGTTSALEGPARILVADDEPVIREASAEILRSIGAVVTTCSNGQDAVDLVRKDPQAFDLILMDLSMPVLDGRAALREIRKLNPGVKVVFASGYHGADDLGGLEVLGATAFLQKPYAAEDLASLVNRLLL